MHNRPLKCRLDCGVRAWTRGGRLAHRHPSPHTAFGTADTTFGQVTPIFPSWKVEPRAHQSKTVAHGAIAMYGTYTVDEATKTIIVNFEGSSFANFNGASGKRIVTSITADAAALNSAYRPPP